MSNSIEQRLREESGRHRGQPIHALLLEAAAELEKWRPLTDEEAQAAYDAAEAKPMDEEEVKRIVEFATDPANRLPNGDQAVLVGTVRKLWKREEELKARIAELEVAALCSN